MIISYLFMLFLYLLVIYMLWNNFDNLEKTISKIVLFILIIFGTTLFYSNVFANEIQHIRGRARVIDGDTIQIHNEKIRLACIDTPESNFKGKIQFCLDNETDCGFLAKRFLWDLLENKKLICDYTKRDMYGRIIGMCYDDTWNYDTEDYKSTYNYKLVEEGYAWYYPGGKECDVFKTKFEEVYRLGIGLFDGSLGGFKEPKLWRKTKTND